MCSAHALLIRSRAFCLRVPTISADNVLDCLTSHRDAIRNWQPSDLPDSLDDTVYTTKIQPVLDRLSKAEIARALGVTKDYAYEIARGDKLPHRRHWVLNPPNRRMRTRMSGGVGGG